MVDPIVSDREGKARAKARAFFVLVADLFSFSERAARRRCWLWALLASVNLTYGVLLASHPSRTEDLLTVLSWAASWLLGGENLYVANAAVDYPPHAIVALAPLTLVPPAVMTWGWVGFNVALAVAVPMLALSLMSPSTMRWGRIEVALLFLCWSGTKVLTQYSLLTFALGLVAIRLADTRPMLSGVAVGLALMKPQIAFPVALWMALTGRWRIIATAVATVVAGWLVYSVRAGVNPLTVAVGYAGILQAFYTGRAALDGASHLRPLLEQFGSPESAELVAAGATLVMLAMIVGLARRLRQTDRLVTPALGGAWSLATFYHLTYGFILLLPAAILLRLGEHRRARTARAVTFWVMQAGLIVDVPGVARRLDTTLPDGAVVALQHADRLLVLLIFGAAFWFATAREDPSRESQVPGPVGLP